MSPSDINKNYKAKEEQIFFDDGREIELLHFVYGNAIIEDIRGSPERVLGAIDEYARTKKYLMNVGEDKGRKVTNLIADTKPDVMVEMGGYVGYSTILFADALRKAGGRRYFTMEGNPEFAAIISSLADLAGLGDIVKVVVGSCEASIRRLNASGEIETVDMMFLDHWKPAYTTDLKLCEELGLVRPGCVIAADNVIFPGNPPYLEYVRSSVEAKRAVVNDKDTSLHSHISQFAAGTANQYVRSQGTAKPNYNVVGNPNLIYESELIPGFEPSGEADGVEFTRCILFLGKNFGVPIR